MDVWRCFRLLSVSKGSVGLAVYNDVMIFISFLVSMSTNRLLIEVFPIGGSIN
jgi:hypothetical protein